MLIGQKVYNYVRPPRLLLSPRLSILLEKMYPNINWKAIVFYDGIPWFMARSFAIGTALPIGFISQKKGIYLQDFNAMSSDKKKLLLVHEAYHIQQYQDLQKKLDWGFNCGFMRYYLAWNLECFFNAFFVKKMTWKAAQYHAYRQHPMEIPAYDHEAKLAKRLADLHAHTTGVFFKHFPYLVIQKSTTNTPHFFFLIIGTILSILIAISRFLIESILLFIAIVLRAKKRKPTIII